MEIQRYFNAKEFLKHSGDYLERNEVTNNLALGILYKLEKESKFSDQKTEPFFSIAEHRNHIVFVMLMTPPHNLIVYGEEKNIDTTIYNSISFLLEQKIPVPGVIGPRETAAKFASCWAKKTGCRPAIKMEQMIYILDKVNEIELCPGRLAPAKKKDLDIVTDWIFEFSKITLEKINHTDARKKAEKAIKESCIFLWQDKMPLSMAMKARPTKNGIVISGVYTPPEHRNKGYATSCVASLSKQLLNEGNKFLSLYTDLSNPTSNSIYRKIGYRPVTSSIVISFN